SDIYSLDPFITQMLEVQGVKAIAVFFHTPRHSFHTLYTHFPNVQVGSISTYLYLSTTYHIFFYFGTRFDL
ncbi:hypothetical protein, partial [Bacteroides xylanisolvens]|uniref:hypothetical protein n=1 Tax=Bacteroides xylanisolvens TaxID=371601 RepID=UPI001F5812C3